MTMQFRLPAVKYDTPDKIWAMFERTIAEIRAMPGVKSAALVRAFPLTGNGESYPVRRRGAASRSNAGDAPQVQINAITPSTSRRCGIPRLLGPRHRDVGHARTRRRSSS